MLVMVSLISSKRLQRGGADLTRVKLNRLIDSNRKAPQPDRERKTVTRVCRCLIQSIFSTRKRLSCGTLIGRYIRFSGLSIAQTIRLAALTAMKIG